VQNPCHACVRSRLIISCFHLNVLTWLKCSYQQDDVQSHCCGYARSRSLLKVKCLNENFVSAEIILCSHYQFNTLWKTFMCQHKLFCVNTINSILFERDFLMFTFKKRWINQHKDTCMCKWNGGAIMVTSVTALILYWFRRMILFFENHCNIWIIYKFRCHTAFIQLSIAIFELFTNSGAKLPSIN
jgi:hypothetical protein